MSIHVLFKITHDSWLLSPPPPPRAWFFLKIDLMLQELRAHLKYVVQNMPCLSFSSQRSWVRCCALGVCSRKQNLHSKVEWKAHVAAGDCEICLPSSFLLNFQNSHLYILCQGRVRLQHSDDEIVECRALSTLQCLWTTWGGVWKGRGSRLASHHLCKIAVIHRETCSN